jgi:quinohemoprotein amine dehydrogenase
LISCAVAAIVGLSLSAQEPQSPTNRSGNQIPPETEVGIPVTDNLTVERCSGCHKADDKSNLTRISWIRTTPEGWEEAIKRMVRLNGLALSPEDGRHILAYLAKDHGFGPAGSVRQPLVPRNAPSL